MNLTINNYTKVYKAKPCSVYTMAVLGYELVDELFVDSSGFGMDSEPALTVNQFETRLQELLNEHGKLTAKITSFGQFQVYVGLFKKTRKPQAKRIASNVLLIEQGDGKRIVRLYETDILTDNGDGTITVDNGGYATRTTHKRINEFSNLHATSRQYETFINGVNLSERSTFNGHLTI